MSKLTCPYYEHTTQEKIYDTIVACTHLIMAREALEEVVKQLEGTCDIADCPYCRAFNAAQAALATWNEMVK